jgi:F-type H+-transporting ATPase subunit a
VPEPAVEHAADHGPAPAAGADVGAVAHGSAGAHGGAHHAFDFAAAISHHNLAYPAWEPIHGTPLLIFDLADYAAKNQAMLLADGAKAQPDAAQLAWAREYAAEHGAPAEAGGQLATAMAVAEQHSWLGAFPRGLSFFNQQIFFGTVAMLLLAAVLLVFARRRPGEVKPQGRIQHMLEAIVLFVRDDIVRPNIHHGDKWTAHFAAIFLAILACNLIGLIPGTGTATGNVAVTTALALTTLGSMLFFGMKAQGVAKFWINLVPVHFSTKPAELMIWCMLAGIEILGLLIKPTALAIRLFANMFAGHTVLLAFCSLGLIIFSARPDMSGLAVGMSGFGLLLAFAIFFLELLVAFIQAYVFTLLSAVFIGQSMHPEH